MYITMTAKSPGIFRIASVSSFLMPRAKKTRGIFKNVSCPRCGKRFGSETNVLRHLNQPMGPCYGANVYQDHVNHRQELVPDSDQPGSATGIPDGSHFHFANSDFMLNDDYPPDSDLPGMDQGPGHDEMDACDGQKFTEPFPGCSDSYPGGITFMDQFWQDQYANERLQNLYFPFASAEEWQFSSWCLRSGLSMASIDSLLSLSIVSTRYFCLEL